MWYCICMKNFSLVCTDILQPWWSWNIQEHKTASDDAWGMWQYILHSIIPGIYISSSISKQEFHFATDQRIHCHPEVPLDLFSQVIFLSFEYEATSNFHLWYRLTLFILRSSLWARSRRITLQNQQNQNHFTFWPRYSCLYIKLHMQNKALDPTCIGNHLSEMPCRIVDKKNMIECLLNLKRMISEKETREFLKLIPCLTQQIILR